MECLHYEKKKNVEILKKGKCIGIFFNSETRNILNLTYSTWLNVEVISLSKSLNV